MRDEATFRVKAGLAEMLKGGVIMDVVDAEQAKIAEDAGAAAVMALERVPADIRRDGGVARMSDPMLIKGIQEAVTIPVMAKARIGHFVEAQVLEALEVDYIDESEVLTPADEANHIDKWAFKVPFVCGATNLGEALRRIARGRGDDPLQGRGRHRRHRRGRAPHAHDHRRDQARSPSLDDAELATAAKELQAPLDLVRQRRRAPASCRSCCSAPAASPRRPTPSLMMQLGAEGVFVGSGIFKSEDPATRAARDRRGDDPLPGPASASPAPPRASARRCTRSRRASSRSSSCSPTAAGERRAARRRPRPAGRLRGARADAARARRRACARSACPPTSTGSTGS